MDEHVDFTAMKDGTREEYELLARLEKPYLACLLYTSDAADE